MSTTYSGKRMRTLRSECACPLCGEDGAVKTSWEIVSFGYGAGESVVELSAEIPVHTCTACEFQYLDDQAERLKHSAVCRHLGILSPDEIRRIRKDKGMSRSTFSKRTGIGEASLNRWENGLTVQTQAYDRYLRLLALPGTMRNLETSFTPRFRVLSLSDAVKNEQKSFCLRKAA